MLLILYLVRRHPSLNRYSEPMKIAADVDTGIDDALALVYLSHWARAEGAELVVTTSAGNCTATQAAANTLDVLRASGEVNPQVVVGAAEPGGVALTTTPETHGPDGLGYHRTQAATPERGSAEAAVAAWQGAEKLLVAGPAMNLAHGYVGEVTLMCGAFHYPGNTTDTAEWNAWVDPHGLRDALRAMEAEGVRHTMCPLNVTERVVLQPARLQGWCAALRKQGRGQLAALLEDALRFYFEFHESVGDCAQIHDLAAAMVMLGTVEYEVEACRVDVEVEGERRGTVTCRSDGAGMVGPTRVLTGLDPEAVFAEFEGVVLGFRDGVNF